MKRKGVDYCPVIMRYATVKRELAQDSFIVTYMYNLRNTFLGKWFTAHPPPPPPGKIAHTPICTLRGISLCFSSKIGNFYNPSFKGNMRRKNVFGDVLVE